MKYIIVKGFSENMNTAKSMAQKNGKKYLGKIGGSYCCVCREFASKEEANKALQKTAFIHAAYDCDIHPNTHSWSLFCASLHGQGRAYTRKYDGCRVYNDGDCTSWTVELSENFDDLTD